MYLFILNSHFLVVTLIRHASNLSPTPRKTDYPNTTLTQFFCYDLYTPILFDWLIRTHKHYSYLFDLVEHKRFSGKKDFLAKNFL